MRHPEPKLLEDLDSRSMAVKANRNPEMYEKFETLLEVSALHIGGAERPGREDGQASGVSGV